ncbi:lysoplasmalogenase [Microbacterium sp. MPKO10]|uniref:lysoplasmalogenase n=1 Tax=Microbacterium sp. MPKO10 TaxID=2989818 RepID=UPI0022358A9D|nr:lysoplasmalogenase [Microbacterium sp. MPKO10]MCW4459747.1 lysoplasmalogenase [Microbacterium sp. MPKO10]
MHRSIPRSSIIWSLLPYALMAVTHVAALAASSPLAAPTKLFLMPLLLLPVAVHARRLRSPGARVLLVVAIVLSWLGDAAGAFFPFAPELPMMLLFFGLAHVAYMVLFGRHARVRRVPLWALVYAAWWGAMMLMLFPHVGGLLIAVACYGLVLGGTAALSARCTPVVAIGGAFFLLSDSLLAFRLFLPAAMPPWTSPAVMATYALGQGLIVAGVLWTLSRPDHHPNPADRLSAA